MITFLTDRNLLFQVVLPGVPAALGAVDDFPCRLVHGGEKCRVEIAGVGQVAVVLEPLGRALVGIMRGVHGEVYEERLVLVLLHERTGFFDHQVGENSPS